MKNKKLTITIGIPAHNEEANIGNLLDSILRQKHSNYSLKKILVVCDGCNDNTAEIVKNYRKSHRKISLFDDGLRFGKSQRLNYIYSHADTDCVLTFDADIILDTDHEIEELVRVMNQSSDILLVGPRYVPIEQKTIWGKFSYVSYLSFEDAILKYNNGNNFFALMGCASLIKKELYSSIRYPKDTISDQNFLYGSAILKNPNAFSLARNARVFISTVSTFEDWRKLGLRSVIGDKKSARKNLGRKLTSSYKMPFNIYFISLLKWLLKSPLYTSGSIFMNIFIRAFPYKREKVSHGIWESTKSAKIIYLHK